MRLEDEESLQLSFFVWYLPNSRGRKERKKERKKERSSLGRPQRLGQTRDERVCMLTGANLDSVAS
jgi:hypothetical protein